MREKWEIAIIGGGPGGYVAALRAAQLKKRVVLIEKEKIGGTCINHGCIPAKYLLHQAKLFSQLKSNKSFEGPLDKIQCNWKMVQDEKNKVVERLVKGIEFLLKRTGVTLIKGTAHIKNERHIIVMTKEDEFVLEAKTLILAAGSRPAQLPFLTPNGQEVTTSRQALQWEVIPQKLLIVGAGAIGLEMGTIFQKLGSDVTVLEILPSIIPGADREITTRLKRILKLQGLKIHTQMRIEKAVTDNGKVTLEGTCLKDQAHFSFQAEKVLLAVGRLPNSLDLNNLDLNVDDRGFVQVNSYLETSTAGVYAIGDLIGGNLYAHKASHEGIIAVENASRMRRAMKYHALPMAVYTEPEFSYIGLTEQEAKERGLEIKVGHFSLQANGRALTLNQQEGMVKIIADKQDKIIGAHILSPHASELIAEVSLAMNKGMSLRDISESIHVHPTLSEALMEASMNAKGEAIHMLNA
jgi:dihydrolipoamide dehydrogenase